MIFRPWFTCALLLAALGALPVVAGDDDVTDLVTVLSDEDVEEAEDELEDALEDSEEVEDDLEDELEDRMEEAEELEDELEDRLEDMLEEQEEREDDLEDELEDQLEDQLEQLQQLQEEQAEQQTERLQDLWQLEEQVEDLEAFAVPDEFIALLTDEQLQQAIASGSSVLASERLDALGTVLVTFASEEESARFQADDNHLYQLDAQAAESTSALTVKQVAVQMGITTGEQTSLVIGMMDSAIDTQHNCIDPNLVQQQAFYRPGLQPATAHGTAIAALMSGPCGLLSNTALVNAEVFAASPKGMVVASARDMIAGLNWLVGQGVQLINLSLSGPENRILQQALEQVMARGILVVASAGNEGAAAFPRYPAAYPGVLAITAVDAQLEVYPRAVRGAHIDFAAPGVSLQVAAADGAATIMSGTSVAAALATAGVALAHDRQLNLEQLQQRAMDLGAQGKDPVYGYGLLVLAKKNSKGRE